MNNEKGPQGARVFSDDVDAVLADKIVAHTEKNSGKAKTDGNVSAHSEKNKSSKPSAPVYAYRTPEQRRRVKGAHYGIAALVFLAILGALTYILAKFNKD